MTSLVYDWLCSVNLGHRYSSFECAGIVDPEAFLRITIQDYPALGISELAEKQALFFLIQDIKNGNTPSAPAPAPVSAPAPAPLLAPAPSAPTPASPLPPLPSQFMMKPPIPRSNVDAADDSLFVDAQHDRIRVVVRKRPMSRKEAGNGENDILSADADYQISVHEPRVRVDCTRYTEVHSFMFDEVFDIDASNHDVYRRAAAPLVAHMFTGGKSTCFAYGQTGAGKTYTMMEHDTGIYVLAAKDIFQMLSDPVHQSNGMRVDVSFFEIYGGNLFDLLNNRERLYAREDAKGNVVVTQLTEMPINSVASMLEKVEYGLSSRSVGSTSANADSSRSHAILSLTLKNARNRVCGKISFIDLAGSERAADTMATDRRTRMEGADINKSLLSLKECIRALDKSAGHTPFRSSKLTMVLKDSFIGNARTVMIANVAPNSGSSENTLNTLRYADRVKELKSGQARAGQGMAPVIELESDEPIVRYSTKHGVEPGKAAKQAAKGQYSRAPSSRQGIPAPAPAPAPIPAPISAPAQPQPQPLRMAPPSRGLPAPAAAIPQPLRMMPPAPAPIPAPAPLAPAPAPAPAADFGGDESSEEGRNSLERTHEDLVAQIYILEDQVVSAHREHVDAMMKFVKQEVQLLHGVERGNIDIDSMCKELDAILQQKQSAITSLASLLSEYRSQLAKEELLSASVRISKH